MEFKHAENKIWLENEAGKEIAVIDFPEERPGVVNIVHTQVDGCLQGQGVAGKITQAAADRLRKEGRKAVLSCSYSIRWFGMHPEYADILADPEAEAEKAQMLGGAACGIRRTVKSSTPVRIGSLELNSRIVMPPMATYYARDNSTVTDELLDYYNARAKNPHIGLIITEHAYIEPAGRANAGQLSISKDEDVEGLKKIVEAIHKGGCKTFAQLNHAGSAAPAQTNGIEPVSASAIAYPGRKKPAEGSVPRALSIEEIANLKDCFVRAALRAKEAGYDGVEIHSAHGYLLNQFYSPLSNKRTDAYGGTLENRIRFHVEVLKAVREAVGEAYPVAIRLGGCDYMEGGSTIADAVAASKFFEEAGADLIDLSGGLCGYQRPDGDLQPGYFKDLSAAVKQAVSVPVLLTGGVHTLQQADALLAEGAADLIGVGRELLKTAGWEM